MKKLSILSIFVSIFLPQAYTQPFYHEPHRPQVHFSSKEKWINDPNGMVYYKGLYHLFFQYYPDSTVWGPMHWGHAVSTDLVRWKQLPIALYPDSLGYIFSGSAVLDAANTSGFGKNGQPPLVAIFTSHDPKREREKRNDVENQSIAYSLDEGNTWTKYAGNPVLKNPGVRDFRDPKVMWFEPGKKWVMTLATQDRITFFSSPDLKSWNKESEFGKELGAHGGVWECPDLFSLNDGGKPVWVLIVNLNPGAPNGGSGTQYFLGDFDGHEFKPLGTDTKWIDYGPDNYAGITWSNTGNRKIFLGWMSNWLYANQVPTGRWRNAMTIPRELRLRHTGSQLLVSSEPVTELSKIRSKPVVISNVSVKGDVDLSGKMGKVSLPCLLRLSVDKQQEFSLEVSNGRGEKIVIGYDQADKAYFIDRSASGKTDFNKDFAARHTAPRLAADGPMELTLLLDESSAELFADGGLTVMTEIFFPSQPYDRIHVKGGEGMQFKKIEYTGLKSIWP